MVRKFSPILEWYQLKVSAVSSGIGNGNLAEEFPVVNGDRRSEQSAILLSVGVVQDPTNHMVAFLPI